MEKKTRTKRRRSHKIDILLTCVVLSLILGGSYLIFMSKKSGSVSAKNTNFVPVTMETTVDTIDSKYEGIKIQTEISNDPTIPVAIQSPETTNPSFNENVNKYIEQIKGQHLKEINDAKKAEKNTTSELNISFKTFSNHTGLYSFVLESQRYVGEATELIETRTFNFDPKENKNVTVEELFNNDVEKLTQLSKLVHKKLENDASLKEVLSIDDLTKYTEPIWENYQNFALTDKEFILYLNVVDATDVPTVSFPLSTINNLLAIEFQKKKVKSSQKQVALTFDDGPEPKVTTQILNTLKKYDAKATFFMLGNRVEKHPEIAKDVQAAGHELANHSWNHPNLALASAKKVGEEINNTSSIIKEATGQEATLFRPPYGAFNETVKAESDLPIILWDVDTLDWQHRSPQQLLAYVKQGTRDGSIILMHDIHQSTADGLDAVLAYLKAEGYAFVTVSELDQ